ncbi:hypothetical protein A2865_03370 [Candidatus Woesebacteria bacterium RIFCSPHIGHO2_01_FULL_39_17]|uniref:Phosphodiester glycosidase domain-containing protein n=3 Tax=Candidatus Woeseibacteriota TaxID=1752722 RepID=A0A0G0QS86_9BACT|nr:MAG: hypothetical protein US72_C0008G0007 [Microgenomates group bacterium GW2011_GWC1_38_12]KKQ93806.1 MAG: hypothetical protein UT19_C0007G0050 [Candidatus Woesebacteria bacterium GW2011_GWB1_39_10b]KKR13225.1 MAG: hypothetical protein UT40_C0021G0007 [Candidatus Woesebacteria bacterium GW2011_GWA1_39_21b]OGM23574.1 MAG: hypothetical protein A2865_03370 [Candidatus Woesebacteria bacterium RIFCSPHIGHO2_01_FULL_39_17]OGM63385.1 MAG: hypothetical protein A3A52_04500 [Candidatus Woesebacteria b
MKLNFPKSKLRAPKFRFDKHVPIILVLLIIIGAGIYFYNNKTANLQNLIANLTQDKDKNLTELERISKELEELKNQDQLKRNEELQTEIKNIEKTYDNAVTVYENLLDFKAKAKDTKSLDTQFAKALSELAKRDFAAATSTLSDLSTKIDEEDKKISASITIPQNIPESNAPPGSGYARQSVNIEGLGTYMVSLVAADLGSTKVIVDTAADSDCSNDCPVLPLATYVSRNGAFAGVNGSYFCPAEYPTCAGKTNSFDLLVMNYKKTYFNSGNNVYSGNPAVIFGDSYIRFVSAASQWGRDTSPNGVLSNYPLLVQGGNITFGGDDDPKKGSKGGRSFVANKGNTVYIGVVHNATVAESARVMKALGMENALNLDDGGSTALWSGGYKVGPGRNLPNVILFLRK